ncbi:MAG: recombinase family protein [Synergistaceae bacterium]|nr:recombinase family protein [Synergistaceae bacterium]
MNTNRKVSADSKQKIRTRYREAAQSEIEVIPAECTEGIAIEQKKLKVAAYVRVSTENDAQTSSYELQAREFTERIKANPNWEFVDIYGDDGISGTGLSHRKGMLQMLEDAEAGKIQYILAKNIARFARNVTDCSSVISRLRDLNVGVHFDESNLDTLDENGACILTIFAALAEEESRSKSSRMNWSIENRFKRGIFLTPKLLGYDLDGKGNLIVNPNEAETVKVIYYLYINGRSVAEIADLLTEYKRTTKTGNEVWNPASINDVIENERYCGDVLARKTYTPDFRTHKSVKNRRNRNQYRQHNHHEPIVSRDVYDAAKLLKSYGQYCRSIPVLSVIDDGILRGYVPIDINWTGFTVEDYKRACESAGQTEFETTVTEITVTEISYVTGCEIVRADYFSLLEKPHIVMKNGKLKFSTVCLKKFEDVEHVELLLNTLKKTIAVRPCSAGNPNAIRWGQLHDKRLVSRTMSCKGLSGILFALMNWEEKSTYKFIGQFLRNGEEKLLLFELDETAAGQSRYIGEWDSMRPARELEEMNILTTTTLNELLKEAETIIEGWERKTDE